MPQRLRLPPCRRTMRRRILRTGFLAPWLAGCGFKLRGALPLPFQHFYTSAAIHSALGSDLRRALRAHGATIVEQRDAAPVRLDVLIEAQERDISALSTAGRPREFQLRLRVRWQVQDATERSLIPAHEILLSRTVTVLDSQGIANPDEEALLYRDMRSDAVEQIVRRLATLTFIESATRAPPHQGRPPHADAP
jgi:LPS-assembly lipoprotein